MVVCIICIIAFAAGLLCGFGLGRNGSASRAGGYDNSAAVDSVARSQSILERAESAVEGASRANTEAAETIKRMRDIVDRHCSSSSGNVSEGETR